MAEYSAVATQTVAVNQNILFTGITSPCNRGFILHRNGSGQFTVKGCTQNCHAKYHVDFYGNLAVPAGGTPGEISVAIAVNGEPDLSTLGRVTPTAAGTFFNVAIGTDLWVPKGCCVQVSVKNTSDQPIDVSNANITINRIG